MRNKTLLLDYNVSHITLLIVGSKLANSYLQILLLFVRKRWIVFAILSFYHYLVLPLFFFFFFTSCTEDCVYKVCCLFESNVTKVEKFTHNFFLVLLLISECRPIKMHDVLHKGSGLKTLYRHCQLER